ncbi:hypothetical protein J2X24_001413 [Asticcacaulis solisilvae]|uniref:hypothetical protein n=1 Tax=Asticcacaulis solisilvae TaxID=1217274 RepID=UPI001AEB932A|nr:hypothetical protein [Asticcacaulis solisilvae]MBP2158850.1 hypothetical protein [Asticcacaulis solisilvae]
MRQTLPTACQQVVQVKSRPKSIRAALIEAENSGAPQRFGPEAFKRRMQKAYG